MTPSCILPVHSVHPYGTLCSNMVDGSSMLRAAHPTARAFFDALDTSQTSSKQSEALKRRSQSVGWRNRHSQDDFYPVQVLSSQFAVEQKQRGEIEGTYGTGATVWPAAMVLVKYMERHRSDLIQNKRIVDLGSGTGITTIAAAVLGASSVYCTDGEDRVVDLANKNIRHAAQLLNADTAVSGSSIRTAERSEDVSTGPNTELVPRNRSTDIASCSIHVQKLWWGEDALQNHDGSDEPCDVVLVADCVLPKLYPIAPLVQAIDELLVKPTAAAVLSYEHRYYPEYHPRDRFVELAEGRGLAVSVVSQTEHDPVYSVEDIEIWHVRRK